MQFIIELIKSTAIPMQEPKSYGFFHLAFFLGGLAASVLIARKLRNADDKQNRKVLLACGLIMLILEIYKQIFQYVAIGYETYPFGIFPFHLCSTPMYLCTVAAFVPEGRFQTALFNYIGTFGFLGGFISWFEPSGLLHEYWVATLHSCIWHIILVFVGIYLGTSKRIAVHKKDFKDAAYVFLVLCGAALVVNLIFWKASGGTANMFFIGPAGSSLVVFRDISRIFGWYINTPLFMGCVIFAAFMVYSIYRKINEKSKITVQCA